jgi:pimeloyl-ACP methyl ester carboxylesterase
MQRLERDMECGIVRETAMDVTIGLWSRLRGFRATHPTRCATIGGIKWEYIVCGHGEKVLLILPGLFGIGEMSFEQIMAFEGAYRVIVPSYPAPTTRVLQLIRGIVGILDAEQMDRVSVLGGSYGGMVAQCLLRQYPDRVGKLILSHTGVPRPDRAVKNRRFLAMLRLLPTGLLRAMLRLSTRKSMADAPTKRAFWEAYSNEMIAQITKADLIARYEVAIDFDVSCASALEDLKNWPGRILILEGDNDPVAGSQAGEALRALYPQAAVHTFHGSGHVASITKLDEYVAVIRSFLHPPDPTFGGRHSTL